MKNSLLGDSKWMEMRETFPRLPLLGDVAEIGVWEGGCLEHLCKSFPKRNVYGFDTFAGLPVEQHSKIDRHRPREFAVSRRVVEMVAPRANLIEGIFPDTLPEYKGPGFAFVHLDVDTYLGIKLSLEALWPLMIEDGIIVVDDYGWSDCPGVKKAVKEFGQPFVIATATYQAFLKK